MHIPSDMFQSAPIITHFVFHLDDYNADHSYKDSFLRDMLSYDPTEMGALSFVSEEDGDNVQITAPRSIGDLVGMVEILFRMWDLENGYR